MYVQSTLILMIRYSVSDHQPDAESSMYDKNLIQNDTTESIIESKYENCMHRHVMSLTSVKNQL